MKSRKPSLSFVAILLLVTLTSIFVILKVTAQVNKSTKAGPVVTHRQQKMEDMQDMMAPIQRKSRIGALGSMAFVIQQVQPGTPVEQVGLEIGDLVTQVNGEQVSSLEDFHSKISASEPGTSVTIVYLRYDPTSKQFREHTAVLKTVSLFGPVGRAGLALGGKIKNISALQCSTGCCSYWRPYECFVGTTDTGRTFCRLTSTGSCLFLVCV
jgi:membrane-associated protease RseP (regulator of RpoE activity)